MLAVAYLGDMMSDISDWKPVAADNTANPPDSAPENSTLISDLNNIIRELQASVRRWYNGPSFRDLGHTLLTDTSTKSVLLEGDVQASYSVGQSVEYDDAGGTGKHGYITAIALDTTNTRITIGLDGSTTDTVDPDVTSFMAGPNVGTFAVPPPDVPGTLVAAVRVTADGGANNMPSNMSVVRSQLGKYRFRHNLGDERYIVQVSLLAENPKFIGISARTDTDFQVFTYDNLGNAEDQGWYITLYTY